MNSRTNSRVLPCCLLINLLGVVLVPVSNAQQKKPAPKTQSSNNEQLGLTCNQILQLSSTEWVARFQDKNPGPEGAVRAISSYGKCYDARTDRLAAALGRSGKGPLMGAHGDFQDFDKRLRDFAAKALAAAEPPADKVKIAYSGLYEKRFRYEFYESYEQKAVKPEAASPSSAKAAAPAASQSTAPPASSNSTSASNALSSSGINGSTTTTAPADLPPITRAKNRFGELLGLLPDEKTHMLHSAFGDIFGNNQVSESTRLAVYQFAIYLLEADSPSPFAPPPF